MFLYARLVCDGLDHLNDLDDMQEEVTNLPNGLSEALVSHPGSRGPDSHTIKIRKDP